MICAWTVCRGDTPEDCDRCRGARRPDESQECQRIFAFFDEWSVRRICLVGDAQAASGERRIEHDRLVRARGATETGERTAAGPVCVPTLGQLGAVEVSGPA